MLTSACIEACIEAHRQAANEGRNQEWIDDTFIEKYGDTYFLMVQSTSKNNANADYTADWVKAYKERKNVVADYPEFAAQIVGDHPGEYNASAREFLLNERYKPGSSETIVEPKDPRTAFEDNQAKQGWIQYKKLTDLLDATAQEAGLESYRDRPLEYDTYAKRRFCQRRRTGFCPGGRHSGNLPRKEDRGSPGGAD